MPIMPFLDDGDPSLDPDSPQPKWKLDGASSGVAGTAAGMQSGSLNPQMMAMFSSSIAGAATGMDVQSLLQNTLLQSTGHWQTSRLTTDKFKFNAHLLPDWMKEAGVGELSQLIGPAMSGGLDPFLPTDAPTTWQVYLGQEMEQQGRAPRVKTPGRQGFEEGMTRKKGPNTEIAQAVMNQPFLWTEDQIADAIKKFQDAGYTNVTDFQTMQKAWEGVVTTAAAMYSMSHGKRKITPWQVLDLYKSSAQKAGTFGGGGGGSQGFTGTRTHTQRTVADITEGDAWSALRQTVSNMLGRDPDDEEVREFAYKMNSLAAKNPSISKTISQYEDGVAVSSETNTRGGFTANDVMQSAYQEAQADPDYAEYQSATTYFIAALSALGAIGGN